MGIKYNNALDFAIIQMMNTIEQAGSKSRLINTVQDAVAAGKVTDCDELLKELTIYDSEMSYEYKRIRQQARALKSILEVRPFSENDSPAIKAAIATVLEAAEFWCEDDPVEDIADK